MKLWRSHFARREKEKAGKIEGKNESIPLKPSNSHLRSLFPVLRQTCLLSSSTRRFLPRPRALALYLASPSVSSTRVSVSRRSLFVSPPANSRELAGPGGSYTISNRSGSLRLSPAQERGLIFNSYRALPRTRRARSINYNFIAYSDVRCLSVN